MDIDGSCGFVCIVKLIVISVRLEQNIDIHLPHHLTTNQTTPQPSWTLDLIYSLDIQRRHTFLHQAFGSGYYTSLLSPLLYHSINPRIKNTCSNHHYYRFSEDLYIVDERTSRLDPCYNPLFLSGHSSVLPSSPLSTQLLLGSPNNASYPSAITTFTINMSFSGR